MDIEENPLVSILIPTFNREEFIEECILSAVNQSYKNIEIVIVDNNSSDRTEEICKDLQLSYKNIRFLSNETNIGPVRNWKKCINEARGKFGKILFSDDLIMDECIQRMINVFLNNNNINVVSSPVIIGKDLKSGKKTYTSFFGMHSRKNYLEHILIGKAPISPGAMLFKIEDLKNNLEVHPKSFSRSDFDMHGAGPDILLILKSIMNDGYIFSLKDPQVFFRSHANSFTEGSQKREIHDGYRKLLTFFLLNEYTINYAERYLSVEYLKDIARGYKVGSFNSFQSNYFGNSYKPLKTFQVIKLFLQNIINFRFNRILLPKIKK